MSALTQVPTPQTVARAVMPAQAAPQQEVDQRRKAPSFIVHFAAGGLGGTVGAAITCPLEVVKTRLQSSQYRASEVGTQFSIRHPIRGAWSHVKGVVGLLGAIRREEGVRALWKGLGPNLIGVVPARAIYFSVYSQGLLGRGEQLQNEAVTRNVAIQQYRNSFHCAYSVVRAEGIRGLYKGLSASVLGLAESTSQFVMYEAMKKYMHHKRLAERTDAEGRLDPGEPPKQFLGKTAQETPPNGIPKYTGLWQSATLIAKEEGIAALYGGMTAHLMRVVPNAAIMFFCYELVVSMGTKEEKH
ncbi:mitochondrial carrier domain-containing protein [Blyttiomyces helicus]|uniref:Mitochondrial carrier domain-containing protein n=1 Tax=Blyttiomyces helicus TaxID=388810 RepID=A0A4P9WHZ7_9FUNG|nr:mitochondrial carrier domain-containing protein [Blyttiomyces helicus]|eukprot:RKO91595.1 mitochondrial carrier domain-containing protein [Blyttiomyces helicus]